MKLPSIALIVAVALCAVLFPQEASAQLIPGVDKVFKTQSNCEEKMLDKGKGWNVVFGPQINEGHYYDAITAITEAIADEDTAPLEEFFQKSIDRIADKMGDDLEELGEQALFDLIMGAIVGNGKPIQRGRMEIEAGLMECQRWTDISLSVPQKFLECKVVYQGVYSYVKCPSSDYGAQIPLIPLNYPYVRYRVNSKLVFPLQHLSTAYEAAANELTQIETQVQALRAQGISQRQIEEYTKIAVEDAIANAILSLATQYLPQINVEDSREVVKRIVEAELQANALSVESTTYLSEVRRLIPQLVAKAANEAGDYIIQTIRERPGSFILDWAETDERTVKRGVAEPGWHVVWGQKINDREYLLLAAAIAAAPETGGASLAAYFETYLARTLVKLEKQAPEISRKVVVELLNDVADAVLSGGDTLKEADLGDVVVQADIATYKRSIVFKYPKLGLETCVWEVNFGPLGKLVTDGVCSQNYGMAEKAIPLPNHHQPYIRFRWKDGRSAAPTGPGQAEIQPVYYPNRIPPTATVNGTVATGGVDGLRVRSAPSTNSAILGRLANGSPVTALSRMADGAWLRIALPHPRQGYGWVSAQYVRLNQPVNSLPVFNLVDELQPGGMSNRPSSKPQVPPPTGTLALPVFDGKRGTYDVWLVSADGTNLRKVVSEASAPALSADGRWLAYRHWDRSDRGIVIAGSDGRNPLRLTAYFEDTLPSFSPDGKRIIFSSYREGDRRSRIYYVWSDEGDYKTWEWNGGGIYGEDPAWAADGGVVYIGLRPVREMRAMQDGGGQLKAIMPPDDSVRAPAVSPDGRQIAYMTRSGDNYEIYVANRDGTRPIQLTRNSAKDGLPVWSPTGKHIAFVSDRTGQWALWIMEANGDNAKQIIALPGSIDGRVKHEMEYLTNGWLEEQLAWSK